MILSNFLHDMIENHRDADGLLQLTEDVAGEFDFIEDTFEEENPSDGRIVLESNETPGLRITLTFKDGVVVDARADLEVGDYDLEHQATNVEDLIEVLNESVDGLITDLEDMQDLLVALTPPVEVVEPKEKKRLKLVSITD